MLDLSYRHCSGYNYVDKVIRAFSHTRLVGAGAADLGNFGFMPTSRPDLRDDIRMDITAEPWSSPYQKGSEHAKPGRYSVFLDDPEVLAELEAFSSWSGVHRYSWKQSSASKGKRIHPGLIFDLCHAADHTLQKDGSCKQAQLTVQQGGRVLEASIHFSGGLSGRGDGLSLHLYAELINPSTEATVVLDDMMVCSRLENEVQGKPDSFSKKRSCNVVPLVKNESLSALPSQVHEFESTSGELFTHLQFRSLEKDAAADFQVEIVVGLSFISLDMAKQNLYHDLTSTASLTSLATTSPDKFGQQVKEAKDVVTWEPSWKGKSIYDEKFTQSWSQWCDSLHSLEIEDFAEEENAQNSLYTMLYSAIYRYVCFVFS